MTAVRGKKKILQNTTSTHQFPGPTSDADSSIIAHTFAFISVYFSQSTLWMVTRCLFSLPDDSILRLLESRKGERETQAFVKKRRQREKQSQEATQTQ